MQAKTYPSVATLDDHMRHIAEVCDLHRVPCGVPEDLPSFLSVLQSKKHLAVAFSQVISSLQNHETASQVSSAALPSGATAEAVLRAHTLEAIVRVVAGVGVSEMIALGDPSRRAVEEMAGLLRGAVNEPSAVHSEPVELPKVESPTSTYVKAPRTHAHHTKPSGSRSFFAQDDTAWSYRMGVDELRQELLRGEYSNRFDSPVSRTSDMRRWFDGLTAGNARMRSRVLGSALAVLVVGGTILHAQQAGSLQHYEAMLRDFVLGTSAAEQHVSAQRDDVPAHLQVVKATPSSKSRARKAGPGRLKPATVQDDTPAAPIASQDDAGDNTE